MPYITEVTVRFALLILTLVDCTNGTGWRLEDMFVSVQSHAEIIQLTEEQPTSSRNYYRFANLLEQTRRFI